MKKNITNTRPLYGIRALTITIAITLLSGCNVASRLSNIGGGPELTPIQNPIAHEQYKPVSMPMPTPVAAPSNPNSLWRSGARAFFKDHRAKEIGDILTVMLELADSADLENSTERDRDDSENTNVTDMLGLPQKLFKNHLPGANPASLMSFGSVHSTSGDGAISRKEDVSLTFAAIVTQILPNGSLVIMGRQEVRVNSELRELMVTGVVRPGDIESDNTITHEKIAEMRVAYGGRGTISNLQEARWGTQVWDALFPF